jgi:hypothetical protein
MPCGNLKVAVWRFKKGGKIFRIVSIYLPFTIRQDKILFNIVNLFISGMPLQLRNREWQEGISILKTGGQVIVWTWRGRNWGF